MRKINWYLLSGVLFIIMALINMFSDSGNSGAGAMYLLAGVLMTFAAYNYSKKK